MLRKNSCSPYQVHCNWPKKRLKYNGTVPPHKVQGTRDVCSIKSFQRLSLFKVMILCWILKCSPQRVVSVVSGRPLTHNLPETQDIYLRSGDPINCSKKRKEKNAVLNKIVRIHFKQIVLGRHIWFFLTVWKRQSSWWWGRSFLPKLKWTELIIYRPQRVRLLIRA